MGIRAFLPIIAAGLAFLTASPTMGEQTGERIAPQVVTQLGHTSLVLSLAFSPDGKLALTGSSDQSIKLWDVATGLEIHSFIGHVGPVRSVAFSPDGRLALSASEDPSRADNTMKLWDVATGRLLRSFVGHVSVVDRIAFSPDGSQTLSGGGDFQLKLWDVASGQELRSFKLKSNVTAVAFSPDGKLALSGACGQRRSPESFDCVGYSVQLWDLASGRELKDFPGHQDIIETVAFSPDGKRVLSGSLDKTLKLWDVGSGRELKSFAGHAGSVIAVAFSKDGKQALSGGTEGILKVWDIASGRLVRDIPAAKGAYSVAFSLDRTLALTGDMNRQTVQVWDLASGTELRNFSGRIERVSSAALSPDGRLALVDAIGEAVYEGNPRSIRLWDMTSGRVRQSFIEKRVAKPSESRVLPASDLAFSPDGKQALAANRYFATFWDVPSGRELRSFPGTGDFSRSTVFSPDGRLLLAGSDATLRLWEAATGRELRRFAGHTALVQSVVLSRDGRQALSGSEDATVRLWDVASGRELRRFVGHAFPVNGVALSPDGKLALSASCNRITEDRSRGWLLSTCVEGSIKLWEVASGRELRSLVGHSAQIRTVAFTADGKQAFSFGSDKAIKLWDVGTGREVRSFAGHTQTIRKELVYPDGKRLLSVANDGTIRLWNLASGEEIATIVSSKEGQWTVVTKDGFFNASQRDTDMLGIVRGLDVTTIGQVHQSLFNPDLVREALAGDPNGEVRRAAEVINLDKVIESGPAPSIEISAPRSGTDLVTVTARVKDRGKGIGRMEWRVNGITASVTNARAGVGPDLEIKQDLALDPGENKIEVIAYNGRNLLASLPARATITSSGAATAAKPRLFVLAIGINAYLDRGWTPAGSRDRLLFPPLKLAAADARAFAQEMSKAAEGVYSDVRVTLALDADATVAGLERAVERIATDIRSPDTFVLFAAAHGYSISGRFYLIPQDYQGGPNPEALASRAIGQERLQDWVANRIKARKGVILLDTCESGALVAGYTRSRLNTAASEAAVGRLHEATGRPVLTAAAEGQQALELTKLGHGVFTSALIDALHHGDTNGNGLIEISELVTHVQDLVPKLIAGGEGRSAIAVRGQGGNSQSARFGATGEDFALARTLK